MKELRDQNRDMTYDKKRFYRAVLVFILLFFLITELPYSDKSLLQFLVLQVTSRFVNGVSTWVALIWALPSLAVFIWIAYEISKSKRFNINGFAIFLVMYVIIGPLVSRTMMIAKLPVYMFGEGLASVEIKDTTLHVYYFDEDDCTVTVDVLIKHHKALKEDLSFSLVLPEALNPYFEERVVDINYRGKSYMNDICSYKDAIQLTLKDGVDIDKLRQTYFDIYDYRLIINHENESRQYIRNDAY